MMIKTFAKYWAEVHSHLSYWDRWCPDDGRVAAALEYMNQYAPEGATEAEVLKHREAVFKSAKMADMALPDWNARQAGRVAWATHHLLGALLTPSTELVRAAHREMENLERSEEMRNTHV
jgi:hypothetical protein